MSSSFPVRPAHKERAVTTQVGEPLANFPAHLPPREIEAVRLWLSVRGSRSRRTLEAYVFQVERFLQWCAQESITLNDLEYRHADAFLRHVQTRYEDKISPKTIDHTRVVLGSMMRFLRDVGIVERNPFATMPRLALSREPPHKILDVALWKWLWTWLTTRSEREGPDQIRRCRDRWVMAFLYGTGLRREEAVTVTMGDFFRREGGLFLRVPGKGRVTRHVVIHSRLEQELRRYRSHMGLPVELGAPETEGRYHVIMSVHPKRIGRPLTPRALGVIVTAIGHLAAQDCPDPEGARVLRSLSPHWLRHTNATHRLLAGASLETTQDELGHAHPHTTRIYAKTIADMRRRDAEAFAAFSGHNDV